MWRNCIVWRLAQRLPLIISLSVLSTGYPRNWFMLHNEYASFRATLTARIRQNVSVKQTSGQLHVYGGCSFKSVNVHCVWVFSLRSYSNDSYFYNDTHKPNWTPVTGYQTDSPIAPPWRVSGAGVFNSIRMLLNAQPTDLTRLYNIDEGYGLKVSLPMNSSWLRNMVNKAKYF